jgi:Tol biopolymer transport system component
MKRRIMKLSLIVSALALLCLVPLSRVRATAPGVNGRIAFQADTGSGNQIYTVRPNGHDLRQITHVNGEAKMPDWSPDGRRIAFEHDQDTADICADIAIMNADGSDLVDLLQPSPNFCEGDPSFTPDGTRIVFERFAIDTGDDAVWSMNVDGSDRRRVVGPFPSGFALDPNVSPDGQTLSFVGWDGALVGPSGEPAKALFTSGIDGSNLFQLTPFTIDLAVKQDWAPDGQHVVVGTNANFFNPGESANIATIRPDGTQLHYLTHYQGGDVNAFVGSYSPDGRWIVFRLEDHGSYGLFRMRADGSDLHVILGFSSFRPRSIDWGPRSLGAEDEDNQD